MKCIVSRIFDSTDHVESHWAAADLYGAEACGEQCRLDLLSRRKGGCSIGQVHVEHGSHETVEHRGRLDTRLLQWAGYLSSPSLETRKVHRPEPLGSKPGGL